MVRVRQRALQKPLLIAALSEGALRSSSMRWVWSSLWSFQVQKDRSERLAFRTRSRRVDEAAFGRHAD